MNVIYVPYMRISMKDMSVIYVQYIVRTSRKDRSVMCYT